jgi:citrate synthase
MDETAKLVLGGKEIELPVVTGTENEKAIDIRKLRAQTGYITLDPGFKNTGSTMSSITYLDGEKGVLSHRGYSIFELAEKSNFLELAYILIYDKVPSEKEFKDFVEEINNSKNIPDSISHMIKAFPEAAHPMAVLGSMMLALEPFSDDDPDGLKNIDKVLCEMIGKITTVAAYTYRAKNGLDFVAPGTYESYTMDFLNMMFKGTDKENRINEEVANALDKLLILHGDHEQNCSTSTVRIVGSAHSSVFACISAGISALWGKLHGGANQAVIEMLESIIQDGGDVDKYLAKAKDKNDPFRLMGFGHRVYRNFDPRARIIKKYCDEVLDILGIEDPALDVARGLEKEALEDEYFQSRKLFPNVDFYSGIIYRALGIPTDMFTVLFAIGRLPGWIAQWQELRNEGQPIGRPRQVYVGATQRPFEH